jgi:hypothetical protein
LGFAFNDSRFNAAFDSAARPSKILRFYRVITALSRGLRDAHLSNLPLTMVPQLSNSTGDLRSSPHGLRRRDHGGDRQRSRRIRTLDFKTR